MKENLEIVAISNRYKNTLDDLIDRSDVKSPDPPKPMKKRSRNALKSEGSPIRLLEGDCLDKDVSDKSLQLIQKTETPR